MDFPPSPEEQIQINTLRQKQFWTASGISALLYTHGCIAESEKWAYLGLAGVMISGLIALINRKSNDIILNERERLRKTK